MPILQCNLRPLAAAVILAAAAGLSAGPASAVYPLPVAAPNDPSAAGAEPAKRTDDMGYSPADKNGRQRHFVILKEEPLASYDGSTTGLQRVPRQSAERAAGRIDVKSREALAYVDHLRSAQEAFAVDVASMLQRPVPVVAQYQHALNAVALDLTPDEAAQLRARDDVKLVSRERISTIATFGTPALIGATRVWSGAGTPGNVATKGEGIVIGIVDTGVNWASDSFKATGADGYTPLNPLGAGTYLGNCRPGGVDAGRCNDKLIGMYNFATAGESGGDLQGHGSHTASTAGGGAVAGAPLPSGVRLDLSGIAPHANIIAYKACPMASCEQLATVGSINQAVADGIVDVINFSIGGPVASPWGDADDLAFLGAANAGIFVSKAAGNDGPSWAASSAARRRGRQPLQRRDRAHGKRTLSA